MLLKVQFAFAGKIIDIAGPTPRSKRDADAPDPVGKYICDKYPACFW